jgi:hypothetical protein
MNDHNNIDQFVVSPDRLIQLCHQVAKRLENNIDSTETVAMQAQLREISRAIERLDNIGVSVPDTLRAEKLRLISKLDAIKEAARGLKEEVDPKGWTA